MRARTCQLSACRRLKCFEQSQFGFLLYYWVQKTNKSKVLSPSPPLSLSLSLSLNTIHLYSRILRSAKFRMGFAYKHNTANNEWHMPNCKEYPSNAVLCYQLYVLINIPFKVIYLSQRSTLRSFYIISYFKWASTTLHSKHPSQSLFNRWHILK